MCYFFILFVSLRDLILFIQTLALYKSFTYLLTHSLYHLSFMTCSHAKQKTQNFCLKNSRVSNRSHAYDYVEVAECCCIRQAFSWCCWCPSCIALANAVYFCSCTRSYKNCILTTGESGIVFALVFGRAFKATEKSTNSLSSSVGCGGALHCLNYLL